MKLSAVILAVALSAVTANASAIHHGGHDIMARHVSLARRAPTTLEKKTTQRKRCRPRSSSSAAAPARTSPAPSSAANRAENTAQAQPNTNNNSGGGNNNNNNNGGGGGGGEGKMIWSDYCGGSRSTAQTTTVSGPNGHIDWLNCGLMSGGWNPPFIRIEDLRVVPLSTALQKGDSPYHACSQFIWIFEKYGNELGIPPIMLAAFAMQESSCRPDTVGGGGEQGLMQITQDKCGGAPGGNCRDPEFNIRTAARYFAQTLAANGGDVLISIGQYNGWQRGLTYERATRAAHSNCCRCQNNVDYLHQKLNGWYLNINAYNTNMRLGKYFNLDVCN